MEFTNLFSGSDNLFKYLFLGGFGMIILSLFYPLQKKQELEIERITYEKEVDLFQIEINTLNKNIDNFEKMILQSSSKVKTNRIANDSLKNSIKILANTLDIKMVLLKYNKSKIDIFEKQYKTYNRYSLGLLIFGILLMVFGGIKWFNLIPKIYGK